MSEPLVTRAEAEALGRELPLGASVDDELVLRFIERWSARLEAAISRESAEAGYLGIPAPFQNTITRALDYFEHRDGFTRTKLLLLEFGVVPAALGTLDGEVVAARKALARDREAFAHEIDIVVFRAISAYAIWYADRWSGKQIEMRMGGTPTLRRKLGGLPSTLFEHLKEARRAELLHLLHHYGVVPQEPPIYDYPEYAPEGYVPPEP